MNIKAIEMQPGRAQALEARFGWRLAAHLSRNNESMPHDVAERLRFARTQALAVARAQLSATPVGTAAGAEHADVLTAWADPVHRSAARLKGGSGWGGWTWLGIAVPALVLAIGLMGIEAGRHAELISVAAEIDAALLGDALPPVAYTDPGFAEYLLEPPSSLDLMSAPPAQ